MYLTQERW